MSNFVLLEESKLFDLVGGSGYGCSSKGSYGCENWSY